MRLLLDTHIWIWTLESPRQLSRNVRRQIENPKNELYVSPISIWEAHLLARRKRIRLKDDFRVWLAHAFERTPISEAPFTLAVAAEAVKIQLPQGDAGDTFLAATALALDLTLVTADEQLLDCSWLNVLANR
jgi:PIN domain nuclease of toxin-antitoxin system